MARVAKARVARLSRRRQVWAYLLGQKQRTRRDAAQFTPGQVAGLRVWLSAAGLALNNGDLVAAWADQSGAGNHVSQSTAAQRPMFIAAAVNGRPVVRFDGVDDGLVSAPSSSLAFTEGTLFVVRNNETDTAAVAVSVVDSIDEEFLLSSTSIYHESEAFNCVCLPHEGSRPGYIVQCGRFGTGPTALENFINGEASRLTMQSFGTPAAYTAVDRVVYVGMRGWPGESLAGDIAEVIVYQGLLTDADRGRVERYLKGRYGIL